MAAKSAARRMSALLGEPVGRTVGYRVKLDTRVSLFGVAGGYIHCVCAINDMWGNVGGTGVGPRGGGVRDTW